MGPTFVLPQRRVLASIRNYTERQGLGNWESGGNNVKEFVSDATHDSVDLAVRRMRTNATGETPIRA